MFLSKYPSYVLLVIKIWLDLTNKVVQSFYYYPQYRVLQMLKFLVTQFCRSRGLKGGRISVRKIRSEQITEKNAGQSRSHLCENNYILLDIIHYKMVQKLEVGLKNELLIFKLYKSVPNLHTSTPLTKNTIYDLVSPSTTPRSLNMKLELTKFRYCYTVKFLYIPEFCYFFILKNLFKKINQQN